MPDQGDPIWGAEERFAEAVELGQPSGTHAEAADPELARDLEIASMLRALGPGFSASADAKARVRARVLSARPVDGPSSDGIGAAGRTAVPESTPDGAPTEQLPVVAPRPDTEPTPAPDEVRQAPPVNAEATDEATAAAPTVLRAVPDGDGSGPSTTVLAEPDLARAVRPRRRRRHALPSRPAARPGSPSVTRRVLAVGMAALFAVLALAGGGVFASRDAVPGDPLYGIKRAAEAAGGIFAGGTSRGLHDLDVAVTRLDEIERMARDGVTDAAAYDSAFQDFDSATGAGARLVLSGGDADRSAADLSGWATQQTARMSTLRTTLPAGAQPGADDAQRLLDRVHDRAIALTARSGCGQLTSNSVDDLGPLPAEGPCVAHQATTGGANGRSGSAPTDRARAAGPPTGHPATEQQQERSQQGDGSDPALLPGVQVGSGGQNGGQDAASPASTTSAAPSSDGKKNVNVPLPLPVPITVPPLVPGKPGGLLG